MNITIKYQHITNFSIPKILVLYIRKFWYISMTGKIITNIQIILDSILVYSCTGTVYLTALLVSSNNITHII